MGMRENWKLYVKTTQAKAEAHEKVAEYWNTVNTNLGLCLIVLSAIVTVISALHLNHIIVVGVSGVTTLLSAIAGFLQPSGRKQIQCDAAKEFRALMMKMIRCETDQEYESLWEQYNKLLMTEPFLPNKYKVAVNAEYSMTPELTILISKKEEAVEEALDDDESDAFADNTPLLNSKEGK